VGGRLTIGPFVRASPLRRRIAALGCEHACRAVLPSAEARGYLRDEHVLRSKLQLPEERVAGVREVLVTSGPVPRPLEPYPPTVDDLDDGRVVATAVRGGADVLVTGGAALPAAAPNAVLALRFRASPKR